MCGDERRSTGLTDNHPLPWYALQHGVVPRDAQGALDPPRRALITELHLQDRHVDGLPRDLPAQVVQLPRRDLELPRRVFVLSQT